MDALWERLKIFEVGSGNEVLTFLGRLARENGWSAAYTERVYDEYLKFVYLTTVSDTPVTPSEAVDQTWHLHLCYTHSYWDDLCTEVLGRPLHHGPTQGGDSEQKRYHGQYEATLVLYEKVFGEKPPLDIWPPAQVRFHPRNRFQWVNRKDTLVLSKSGFAILLALGGAGALLSGCEALFADEAHQALFERISTIVFYLVVIAFVIFLIRKGGKGGGCGSGCSGCSGCGGCGGGD